MSKVAIFASGAGSNAKQIIRYLAKSQSLVCVDSLLTNKKEAGIYKVAEELDIPIHYFSNKNFEESKKIISLLKERGINWIVLAGFLRKIETKLIAAFPNRIINLHPSLLPKYGGKGMYGRFVHKAVLENQETESGISIHLVNEEFDEGAILFQAKCIIEKGQTVEELTQKIQKLEHEFFPKVIEEYICESVNNLD